MKDGELGVVGLGGHQDLDDYCDMPVVRVQSLRCCICSSDYCIDYDLCW